MPGKFPEGDKHKPLMKNRYMKGGKVHYHNWDGLQYDMSMKAVGYNPAYYRKLIAKVYDVIKNSENKEPVEVTKIAEKCKISLELTILVVKMLDKAEVANFDPKNYLASQLVEKSDED